MGRNKRAGSSDSAWSAKQKKLSDSEADLHSANSDLEGSGHESKQMRRGRAKHAAKPSQTPQKAVAVVQEDDQIFEIEAAGQRTEFGDEEDETASSSSETEVGKCKRLKQVKHYQTRSTGFLPDKADQEIVFNFHMINNNATILESEMESEPAPHRSLEDGEYPPDREEVSAEDVSSVIDKKIDESMSKVQHYFERKFGELSRVHELEKQLEENKRHLEQLKARGNVDSCEVGEVDIDNQSELTVYRNAVEKKRASSSSEEGGINSSDDQIEVSIFSERELEREQRKDRRGVSSIQPNARDVMEVTSSGGSGQGGAQPKIRSSRQIAEERVAKNTREAEAAKVRAFDVPGEQLNNLHIIRGIRELRQNVEEAAPIYRIDEDYLLVASHVDETIRGKILNHEFVDFTKLLRRERQMDDDTAQQKMTIVNKGGLSYWVPLAEKQVINGYYKWDQAFRVFLDIYTGYYPERTSELIQYSHIIQQAAMSYSWENVYQYDREFRRHIERHQTRSWGVILQQAWTMFLKDRVVFTPSKASTGSGGERGENKGSGVARKLCIPFNRGHCKYGARCKFEHKCGFCGKYGHGTFNCRKAQAVSGKESSSGGHKTDSKGNNNQHV